MSLVDNAEADVSAIFFNRSDFAELVTWTHGGVSKKITVIWHDKPAIAEFAGIDAASAEPFIACMEDETEDMERGDTVVRIKTGDTFYLSSVNEPGDGQRIAFVSEDAPNG